MALVPSPEGASIPCRYIAGQPKWESLFLFYFRPRKEQERCQSPLPHAGSVGHPGTASCASGAAETCCRNSPAAGWGQHGPNSCQTFSSQRDYYSFASTLLAHVLVTILENRESDLGNCSAHLSLQPLSVICLTDLPGAGISEHSASLPSPHSQLQTQVQ